MAYIKLNRYGDSGAGVFDVATTAEKVRETFVDVRFLPGDQLALSAERAIAQGAPAHIVGTLRRNQQEYGPAHAFEITTAAGDKIQGRLRRYDITFLSADPLPEEWRRRLLTFLKDLGPGRIEEGANDVSERA